MEIKRLTPTHIPGMTAIEQACFSSPWSAESFASCFAIGHTVFFGVFRGEVLAGYAGMQCLYGEGAVTNVGVLPEYRRQGYGEKLMTALMEYAAASDVDSISLEVRESNTAAQNLYVKLGFEYLGIRKDFYTAPKENAVIMQKQI